MLPLPSFRKITHQIIPPALLISSFPPMFPAANTFHSISPIIIATSRSTLKSGSILSIRLSVAAKDGFWNYILLRYIRTTLRNGMQSSKTMLHQEPPTSPSYPFTIGTPPTTRTSLILKSPSSWQVLINMPIRK